MIAIIIPYFKLTYFEETLESLASQTDKRFKVYIGDDASPEDPLVILEKYQGRFDFVYHRFESNLGGISLTQQWERCIDLIDDESWIMVLGDDDFLEETVVASWYRHYDVFNTTSNVIRFATKSVNMQLNNKISDSFTHPLWEKATDSYYRRFKGMTRSTLSEYVFSKEAFLKFGFYDFPLAWHSDDAAWLSFSDHKLLYTINESNLFIRHSSFCISGTKDNQNLKDTASEIFYAECIIKKIYLFTKTQRIDLALEYEISIKRNRKLKNNEWLRIMWFYFSNQEFILLLKCIRRFFLSLLS